MYACERNKIQQQFANFSKEIKVLIFRRSDDKKENFNFEKYITINGIDNNNNNDHNTFDAEK